MITCRGSLTAVVLPGPTVSELAGFGHTGRLAVRGHGDPWIIPTVTVMAEPVQLNHHVAAGKETMVMESVAA